MELLALLIGVVVAIVATQANRELTAWTPRLVRKIVRAAARTFESPLSERLEEEWLAHTDEIPGDIGKLSAALGYLLASHRLHQRLSVGQQFMVVGTLLFHCWSFFAIFLALALKNRGRVFVRFEGQLWGERVTGWAFMTEGEFGRILEEHGLHRLPILWTLANGRTALPVDADLSDAFGGLVVAARESLKGGLKKF